MTVWFPVLVSFMLKVARSPTASCVVVGSALILKVTWGFWTSVEITAFFWIPEAPVASKTTRASISLVASVTNWTSSACRGPRTPTSQDMLLPVRRVGLGLTLWMFIPLGTAAVSTTFSACA